MKIHPLGDEMAGEARPATPKGLEDSGPVFDRARRLVSSLFGGLDAQVVLMAEGQTWRSHDPDGQLPKDAPVAALAIRKGQLIWIADATQDERFKDRPS